MLAKPIIQAATVAAAASITPPKDLDINDATSVRNVAATIAHGAMSLYTGNVTNTPETLAIFPDPVYWWMAGACWGTMLNYAHLTGDTSYNEVITQAINSQVGPKFDLMVPRHYGDEGNDDQAFWSFTILEAAERNFPQPNDSIPPWLRIAENVWNTMVPRWNTTSCGGGLAWQIFDSNPNGMTYKNSVSNGGFFQLSARLARDTGNQTYLDWAQKIWDWSASVGFIDSNYVVYDGADSGDNCTKINPLSFSYSQAIYLYGAAVLYNHTQGDEVWGERAQGLLKATDSYFSPFDNATNIMFEHACETVNRCNTDMSSFKAYMSRFMWATTHMMPSTLPTVQAVLNVSAVAAARACSGGSDGTVCGQRWYVGGYDDKPGLGQQMSALEAVQGLLARDAAPPFGAGDIKHVRGTVPAPPAEAPSAPAPVAAGVPTKRSNEAAGVRASGWPVILLVWVAGALLWELA